MRAYTYVTRQVSSNRKRKEITREAQVADKTIWQLRNFGIFWKWDCHFISRRGQKDEMNDMKFEIPASFWIIWVDCLFYVGKWISIRLQKNEFAKLRKKPDPVSEVRSVFFTTHVLGVSWLLWTSFLFLFGYFHLFQNSIPVQFG